MRSNSKCKYTDHNINLLHAKSRGFSVSEHCSLDEQVKGEQDAAQLNGWTCLCVLERQGGRTEGGIQGNPKWCWTNKVSSSISESIETHSRCDEWSFPWGWPSVRERCSRAPTRISARKVYKLDAEKHETHQSRDNPLWTHAQLSFSFVFSFSWVTWRPWMQCCCRLLQQRNECNQEIQARVSSE